MSKRFLIACVALLIALLSGCVKKETAEPGAIANGTPLFDSAKHPICTYPNCPLTITPGTAIYDAAGKYVCAFPNCIWVPAKDRYQPTSPLVSIGPGPESVATVPATAPPATAPATTPSTVVVSPPATPPAVVVTPAPVVPPSVATPGTAQATANQAYTLSVADWQRFVALEQRFNELQAKTAGLESQIAAAKATIDAYQAQLSRVPGAEADGRTAIRSLESQRNQLDQLQARVTQLQLQQGSTAKSAAPQTAAAQLANAYEDIRRIKIATTTALRVLAATAPKKYRADISAGLEQLNAPLHPGRR